MPLLKTSPRPAVAIAPDHAGVEDSGPIKHADTADPHVVTSALDV